MRTIKFLLTALSCTALAVGGDLTTSILRHSINSSVTNKDVVTLAKAGFDEDFIIRAILGARCNCETTSDALASLAEQGISQRVIEVMLDASYNHPVVVPFASKAMAVTPSKISVGVTSSAAGKPSAVPTREPYQAQSIFWGLWRKKSGVVNFEVPKPAPPAIALTVNGQWQHAAPPAWNPAVLLRPQGRSWYSLRTGSLAAR